MTEFKPDELTIPMTQFKRPSGREVHGDFPAPDEDIYQRAEKLIAEDCRFTLEVLTTGQVSLAVEGPDPTLAGEIADIGCVVFDNAAGAIAENLPEVIRQAEDVLAT